MKRFACIASCMILLLAFAGCGRQQTTAAGVPEDNDQGEITESNAVPEDFSFALTWGCYGISSYDSATGRLVKTWDATNPRDYETSHTLSEEEKAYVYGLLSALDADAYPTNYDPNEGLSSEPTMTLILTVRGNGTEKTVRAENIAVSYSGSDKTGRAFLTTCRELSRMLTETEEWKALPDYEKYYE